MCVCMSVSVYFLTNCAVPYESPFRICYFRIGYVFLHLLFPHSLFSHSLFPLLFSPRLFSDLCFISSSIFCFTSLYKKGYSHHDFPQFDLRMQIFMYIETPLISRDQHIAPVKDGTLLKSIKDRKENWLRGKRIILC